MKTTRLEIRLSELMREEWRKTAVAAGLSVSEWVIMRCSDDVRTGWNIERPVSPIVRTAVVENQVVTATQVPSPHGVDTRKHHVRCRCGLCCP